MAQMYLGGSRNFNESTGRYRGGYPAPKMPARPAGYFGGGAQGMARRQQYQQQRTAMRRGQDLRGRFPQVYPGTHPNYARIGGGPAVYRNGPTMAYPEMQRAMMAYLRGW